MRVLRTLEELKEIEGDIVVAIGVFDGVHLGHQEVIRICHDQAAATEAKPWVMTFEPHPLNVLRPEAAPKLLTSLATKLELLDAQEIDGCIVVPFTQEFSAIEPEDFVDRLAHDLPGLRGIVVGENWRFGKRARGDVKLLGELSRKHGFTVHVAQVKDDAGEVVSSSRIREAIASGDLRHAREMLGRDYNLRGQVIHGQKRGRRLGFPTANLDMRGYALPPPGIYAARVRADENQYDGALYIPSHPEPQHGAPEVHLLDFEGDLYGHHLDVIFLEKIRDDDRRFDNDSDLIDQIRDDIVRVRAITKGDAS